MVRELKSIIKKLVVIVVITSVIMSSFAVPKSYAKLTIQDGEFYYAGTTKGSYKPSEGIFSWAFNLLKEIAAFLLALIPNAIRMSFVGYAALAEKLLTWALESTAGVNLQGEDVNATDLSKLSDSTNNVTVQAIVYNMVPALNVNFFDLEFKEMYRKTIKEKDADGNLVEKEVIVSPTGQQLICTGKNCGKSVLECCGEWDDSRKEVKCYSDSCECKNCDACQKYAQLMLAQDPIIIQLKQLIATWYYIIRLLAVAAMCVTLIGIGIKMAVSTIASDKAVYKRMLVDWVVGMVLIFTMHYIMYFSIIVTDILVNTVRESANQINKVSMMQLSNTSDGNEEVEKSNQDLEIDVYEEIRTRAYDWNLIIGLMGMIMYIALVFMAFKYTLIYIKRFLTLAVLTLMAPGIGVAYALQKVLSGKSSSLKTWLTEYLLNLLIQVVHALMYAIFISAALKFSLENISGVLVALILMNFSLKGEGIFRRIFNLDPGNKGLLGATETAGDRDKLMKNAKAMKAMAIGAKPVAKAITAPGRIVLGGAAKAGAAAALMGGSLAKNRHDLKKNENSSSNNLEATGSTPGGGSGGGGGTGPSESGGDAGSANVPKQGTGGTSTGLPAGAQENLNQVVEEHGGAGKRTKPDKIGQHEEDLALLKMGGSALEEQLQSAVEEYKKDPNDIKNIDAVLEADRQLTRFREISAKGEGDLSVGNVIMGHASNMFDINNYFDIEIRSDGSIHHKPKKGAVFGSYKYDAKTGKFVKDKSNAAYTQFGAAKLLGFSDKDKKIFKEQVWRPAVKGIGGMASMFLGMGSLVEHPLIGMGMLAGGAGMTGSMLTKFKKPPAGSPGRAEFGLKLAKDPNAIFPNIPLRRLRFKSFDTPTLVHMRDEVVADANRELSEKLNRYVAKRHPYLYKSIKSNFAVPKTIGFVAGMGLAPVATIGVVGAKGVYNLVNPKQDPKNGRYANIDNPYQIGTRKEVRASEKVRLHPVGKSAWDIVDKQHFEQIAQQKLTFMDEANALINQREISDAKIKVELINQKVDKQIDETDLKEYNKLLVESWAARGYDYDAKTGQITAKADIEKEDVRQKIEIETEENGQKTVTIKRISNKDIETVNKKIDEIISRKLDGTEIDVNSSKVMTEIMKDLSSELAQEGIIGKDQSADILFEQGDGKLKSIIKSKATQANTIVRESQEYKLNTQEFDAVQQAILEVAKESGSADGKVDLSKVDQAKVLAKVQKTLSGDSKPTDGKDKPKGKIESKLDAKIDQISETEKYQAAISTLLSSKNELSQNQLNTTLIRDRVISPTGTISKTSRKVSDKENRDIVKRSVKKQIAEVVEKCSKVNEPVGEEVLSREEKLKQAEEATAGLDSISRDAVLNSLFVITGMEENIKELNSNGDKTLVETSKYKKPTSKNHQKHLRAQLDLTDAEIKLKKAKREALQDTGTDKQKTLNIQAEIDKAAKRVEVAKDELAKAGPVQDVRSATLDVISIIKQKRY